MAGKVVHYEIPVDDSDRAIAFDAQVFAWALQRFGPVEYWTTAGGTGGGIDGALTMRSEEKPALMFYVGVDDIDATLDAVEAAGGRRLTERMPIPGVGWSAFFEDSEQNRVGLFREDATAPMPGGGDTA